MKPLERAIEIAVSAHAGQIDKAGTPYILHPLRIMLRMDGEIGMMAAVLHDVVEDGPGWTFDRLRQEGIPGEVVEAVEHVTKRPVEVDDYQRFILRCALNPVARLVKLADLEDNMDLTRIRNPTSSDFARIEKYRLAHDLLSAASDASGA